MKHYIFKPLNRIMIVDDDPQCRALMTTIFDHCGYNSMAVDDREALKAAEEFNPELVLLDVLMPTINGVELLKELRKVLPDAVFIFVTTQSDDASADFYLHQKNVIGVISKPVTAPQKLCEAVVVLWHLHNNSVRFGLCQLFRSTNKSCKSFIFNLKPRTKQRLKFLGFFFVIVVFLASIGVYSIL